MCFTSYKIISLSSSNWPPGACFHITIVSGMAKRYPGHSLQSWAGLGVAVAQRALGPGNHWVISESEARFINNVLRAYSVPGPEKAAQVKDCTSHPRRRELCLSSR